MFQIILMAGTFFNANLNVIMTITVPFNQSVGGLRQIAGRLFEVN